MEKKKATSLSNQQHLTKDVEFDEELHAYTYQGKKCISCTQLLEKMGIKKSYKEIEHLPAVHAATQKGIKVHAEINKFFTTGDMDVKCKESELFIQWWMQRVDEWENEMSEQILFNENYMVAGTIDAMWTQDIKGKKYTVIADFKTAKQVDLWPAAWQLALYRYLWDPDQSKGRDIKLLVFKFDYDANINKTYLNVEEVSHYVNHKDVSELLACYKEGKAFECSEMMLKSEQKLLAIKASNILASIKAQEDAAKALKIELQGIKAQLYDAMAAKNVSTLKIRVPNSASELSITRVDAHFRKSLEVARLKEENPSIYAHFCKLSHIDPSVRISIKENADETLGLTYDGDTSSS